MINRPRDYYAVLGVKKNASPEEIKQAYRRLAKVHHPDLQPQSQKAAAAEKFKELNEAYEVLSHPDKRAAYDRYGPDGPPGASAQEPPHGARPARPGTDDEEADFSGFSDFFRNLYGAESSGATTRRPRSGPRRGQDVEAELPLTLEDAVRGGEKTLTLDVPTLCPSCAGSGRRGAGFCPSCGGVGEIARPKTITARLPAAVREGARLRLRGQGAAASGGGEPGDLFLRIRFLPHSLFKVSGADLETTVTVMPWVAALGGEAPLQTLEGPLRVKIPAGTHAGRVLRVAAKGLGADGGRRGDLLAAVRIDIPDRADARLEKLYREMKEAAA
ncbi:MAG: DnaJ domain-containing protein [Elusimicrobia bacterium]|nr:DnaJ domain-containing protein [Elusimicrobiota bacterium]